MEGFEAGKEVGRQFENVFGKQKPAEWVLPEDFEEAVYKIANFIPPFDSQEELHKTSHRFAEQLLSLAKEKLDKSAEWSKEDEKIYQSIMDDTVQENQLDGKQTDWLSDIKYRYFPQPQQEWSEEDEEILNRVFDAYDALRSYIEDNETSSKEDKNYQIKMLEGDVSWLKNRLKSLHPKHHWMPSEEQIDALEWMLTTVSMKDGGRGVVLKNLINDLKKQM